MQTYYMLEGSYLVRSNFDVANNVPVDTDSTAVG